MKDLPEDAPKQNIAGLDPVMDVDALSNDINDKNKTRTYLKPSGEWRIGHGLNE